MVQELETPTVEEALDRIDRCIKGLKWCAEVKGALASAGRIDIKVQKGAYRDQHYRFHFGSNEQDTPTRQKLQDLLVEHFTKCREGWMQGLEEAVCDLDVAEGISRKESDESQRSDQGPEGDA